MTSSLADPDCMTCPFCIVLHCIVSDHFFLKLHDAVRKQQLHPPLVLALRDLPLVVRSCREVVEVVSRRDLTAKPKQGGQGQE